MLVLLAGFGSHRRHRSEDGRSAISSFIQRKIRGFLIPLMLHVCGVCRCASHGGNHFGSQSFAIAEQHWRRRQWQEF